MAFNKLDFVTTQSRGFAGQRSRIVNELSLDPGYASVRDHSEQRRQDILTDLSLFPAVRNHAVLTVVGSYAFGMATDESDFDGAVFLKGEGLNIEDADDLERSLNETLSIRGLSKNIYVIFADESNLWMGSRDTKINYFSALGRLIIGRPLTDGYESDLPAISQLIPDGKGSSELLTQFLEGVGRHIEDPISRKVPTTSSRVSRRKKRVRILSWILNKI